MGKIFPITAYLDNSEEKWLAVNLRLYTQDTMLTKYFPYTMSIINKYPNKFTFAVFSVLGTLLYSFFVFEYKYVSTLLSLVFCNAVKCFQDARFYVRAACM